MNVLKLHHNALNSRGITKNTPPHNPYKFLARKALYYPFLILLALVAFTLTGCEKEIPYYDTLVEYHAESRGLMSVGNDSVGRFSQKVERFVRHYPEVVNEYLYEEIQENIRKATVNITITIVGPEWGDTTVYNF